MTYEFMDSSIVGSSAGLSGTLPADQTSFTLESTSATTKTCRYLRFEAWAKADLTIKITSLTVNYIC